MGHRQMPCVSRGCQRTRCARTMRCWNVCRAWRHTWASRKGKTCACGSLRARRHNPCVVAGGLQKVAVAGVGFVDGHARRFPTGCTGSTTQLLQWPRWGCPPSTLPSVRPTITTALNATPQAKAMYTVGLADVCCSSKLLNYPRVRMLHCAGCTGAVAAPTRWHELSDLNAAAALRVDPGVRRQRHASCNRQAYWHRDQHC